MGGQHAVWREAAEEEGGRGAITGLLPVWQSPIADKTVADGEETELSLQEAFRRHKRGFIRRSATRVEEVRTQGRHKRIAKETLSARALATHAQQGHLTDRASGADDPTPRSTSVASPPSRIAAPPRIGERHRMGSAEIRELNARMYTKLCPEVRAKETARKKEEETAAIRERARRYQEVGPKRTVWPGHGGKRPGELTHGPTQLVDIAPLPAEDEIEEQIEKLQP